jgi:endonuclease/exonuclease/phosphatase family metal-dependent hydrolase
MYFTKKKSKSGVRVIFPLIIIGVIAASFLLVAPFIASGQLEAVPVSFYFEQNVIDHPITPENCDVSVMTLNIGHGRGTGLHQLVQSRKKITENADIIADVIIREGSQVTGLQEVDGPGLWNGGLDLIEHLAEYSGYPHGIWTKNVETPALSHGTALLSSLAYSHAESYTFKARPVVLPKGFTIGIFRVSESSDKHVCIVSIHLAPLLGYMRKKQVDTLINTLNDMDYPIIVMGDFNCGWKEGSALNYLADKMNLKTWKPESKELGTHFPGNRRLDWILISEDLDFVRYEVLKDRLSDHHAVKAVIRCGTK